MPIDTAILNPRNLLNWITNHLPHGSATAPTTSTDRAPTTDFVDTSAARPVAEVKPAEPTSEQLAVKELRALVGSGKLKSYYDAAIGATDNPGLKQAAMDLFNRLPVISNHTTAADMVRLGFWKTAPRGYEEMLKSARYVPGRQLLVETKVNVADVDRALREAATSYQPIKSDVLAYDPQGPRAITYRATLAGEDPANKENFLVDVDSPGKKPPTRLSLPKQRIYELNQPHELNPSNIVGPAKQKMPFGSWGTWTMDYSSPWARAKLAEIAITMDEHVQQLDFTKATAVSAGSVLRIISRKTTTQMVEVQKACASVVFDAVDMEYPHSSNPDRSRGNTANGRCSDAESDIGRQAIRGNGMCVQQSTVFGGLMMPFARMLGIDMQFKVGAIYRDLKPGTTDPFADGIGHGWWQLTFRPSMVVLIFDRTWRQKGFALDLAYGFPKGDRYPHNDMGGYHAVEPLLTDVNMNISVETFERQFAGTGCGRENHG